MTRKNAALAAAVAAVGGGTIAVRRRRNERLDAQGMCFRLASLATQDADTYCERVVL